MRLRRDFAFRDGRKIHRDDLWPRWWARRSRRPTESVGSTKAIDVGDMFTLTVGASRLEMRKDGTIGTVSTDI